MTVAALHAADWFQLGAAVFTAVAAFAAWAAVAQVARERRAAQKPELHIEPTYQIPSGDMFLNVFNEGGPAKMVRFIIIEGDSVCLGNLPPTAFLRRGEHRRIRLDLTVQTEAAMAMIVGADLATRFLYARVPNGQERRCRIWGRFPWSRQPDIKMDSMLRTFFPNAPNVEELKIVGYELAPADPKFGVGPMPSGPAT